ncbi:MAG TPA: hypothetical protein VF718_12600 [Allosphingosinicella sp.]|jgi:choline dehydrogenase-like flavoprotein
MKAKIPLRITESVPETEFDVIIVGAGLSGLTSAYSAARANPACRILLLEAGPLGPVRHLDSADGPDTAFARWCVQTCDSYAHPPSEQGGEWAGIGRRVVGGRGLYWGGVLCRINPAEFDGDAVAKAWLERQGLDETGTGYTDVINRLSALEFYWPGGRRFPASTGRRSFASIDRAASRSGGNPTFSPLEYFRLTTHNAVNLSLLYNREVESIDPACDGFTVQHKDAAGRTRTRGRSIILAAGLPENCRLLETWHRTRGIYHFTDHLVAGVACFVPAASRVARLLASAGQEIYYEDRAAAEGFNLFLTATGHADGWVLDLWGMGEKDPGRPLELTTDGRHVTIKGEKSAVDEAKELAMQSASLQVLNELSAEYGEGLVMTPPKAISTKSAMRKIHFESHHTGLALAYSSELGSVDHEACLRNPNLESDDIGRVANSRLFLVGPGALKRMGSANPNLTAMSLAGKVGEAAIAE